MTEFKDLDVEFDAMHGPVAPRFIELEDDQGRSVNAGEWIQRKDGLVALRVRRDA